MRRLLPLLIGTAVLAPLGMWTADRMLSGPARPTELEAPAVHDLAALAPDQAAALDGKRGRFLVTMAGEGDREKIGDAWRDVYECLPLNDPQGIPPLETGPAAKGNIVVEATLRVVCHPRIVLGPVGVAAFVEYRLG